MSRSDGIIFLNDKTRAKVESAFDNEMSACNDENIRGVLARIKAEILQI